MKTQLHDLSKFSNFSPNVHIFFIENLIQKKFTHYDNHEFHIHTMKKNMEIVEAINPKENVKEFVEEKLRRAVNEVTLYKK